MALFVKTHDPEGLWKKFKAAIEDKKIETWEFHDNGVHFTHTSKQWHNLAWFRAVPLQGVLVFNIFRPKNTSMTVDTYAEYHGKLLRALLAHFDKSFTAAEATALGSSGDIVVKASTPT